MSHWEYPITAVGHYWSWLTFLAIEEVEVGFGDGCFKTTSLGVILEAEALDCLPRVVSGQRKNKRLKYKTSRISRGEMLTKKWGEEV